MTLGHQAGPSPAFETEAQATRAELVEFSEDGLVEIEVGWHSELEDELADSNSTFDKEREMDLPFSEKAQAKVKQPRPRGRPRKMRKEEGGDNRSSRGGRCLRE